MALSIPIAKLHLHFYQRGLYDGFNSVVDMGAQDLFFKLNQLKKLLEVVGISYDVNAFKLLSEFPQKRMPATQFYKLLGFKDHKLVDMADRWDAICQDLNYPLKDKGHLGKYDMVTDYGNNEHVFNVFQAYKTMHQLCKKNGILFIQQAVYGGNGYYNFNSSYFEDMAVANQYEILCSFYLIMERLGEVGDGYWDGNFISTESNIKKYLDRSARLYLLYVMRKTSDSDFKTPYQGAHMAEAHKVAGYQEIFLPDSRSRTFVPLTSDAIGGRKALEILLRKIRKKLFRR